MEHMNTYPITIDLTSPRAILLMGYVKIHNGLNRLIPNVHYLAVENDVRVTIRIWNNKMTISEFKTKTNGNTKLQP